MKGSRHGNRGKQRLSDGGGPPKGQKPHRDKYRQLAILAQQEEAHNLHKAQLREDASKRRAELRSKRTGHEVGEPDPELDGVDDGAEGRRGKKRR
jgi:hypothetical protein